MISFQSISICAKRALKDIFIEENTIHTTAECIIVGETFLHKVSRNCLLIEENGDIDIPHDFDELDRKLKLFS